MARDSSGERLPWFKLWTKDFMADPDVQSLSWDHRGRYVWALLCSWETDTPGIATEAQWVKWLGFTTEQWDRHCTTFTRMIGPDPDYPRMLVQKRMLAEYTDCRRDRDKRSKAGAAGAAARYGRSPMAMRSQSDGSPVAVRSQYESTSKSEVRSQKSESRVKGSCSERFASSPPPSPLSIPALSGEWWTPTEAEAAGWALAYPALDLAQEAARMRVWLSANPTRRKTLRGLPRFAATWLAREQDRPHANGTAPTAAAPPEDDGWTMTHPRRPQ